MPVTLFISYSRKNHVLVYRLRRELEALGAKIWIDHTRLKPGTPDWDQAIRDGIQASELVIYAASPAARRSPFVRDELQVAKQFGKTIIPFWLDGEHWIDSAPLGMGSVQYVDARGKLFDSAVAQLAAVCGLRAPGAASTGVKPPTASQPEHSAASAAGEGLGTHGSLSRRRLLIGSAAAAATIAGLGIVLPKVASFTTSVRDQATPTPPPPGQLLWKYDVWGMNPGNVAVDSRLLYFIGSDSNLHAFDAYSGAPAWTYTTGLEPSPAESTGAAVADGVVYFGVSQGDLSAFIALDVATRQPRWRLTFKVLNMAFSGTPVVADGLVYFGDYSGKLYAARVNDGGSVWTFPSRANGQTEFISGITVDTPMIANGILYFSSGDNTLQALNAKTGDRVWTFSVKTGDSLYAPPAVANNLVYFGSLTTTLYALDANTGAKQWVFSLGSGTTYQPATANGLVFVSPDDFSTNIYALDARSGEQRWKFSAGAPSGAVVDSGVLYFGDGSSYRIRALDATSGSQRWAYATDRPTNSEGQSASYSTPVVKDGIVYVIGDTGVSRTLYAVTV